MEVLKINGTDFSEYIALNGYSVLQERTVSESRDINGNLNVDVLYEKRKITCQFIPMNQTALQSFLQAIEQYVVDIFYYDPETGRVPESPMTVYVEAPELNYYRISKNNDTLINGFSVNFIEC